MKTDSMTIDNKELNNVEATKEQTGQTSDTWQIYTKKTHIIGRTVSIVTLVMLVGAPGTAGHVCCRRSLFLHLATSFVII